MIVIARQDAVRPALADLLKDPLFARLVHTGRSHPELSWLRCTLREFALEHTKGVYSLAVSFWEFKITIQDADARLPGGLKLRDAAHQGDELRFFRRFDRMSGGDFSRGFSFWQESPATWECTLSVEFGNARAPESVEFADRQGDLPLKLVHQISKSERGSSKSAELVCECLIGEAVLSRGLKRHLGFRLRTMAFRVLCDEDERGSCMSVHFPVEWALMTDFISLESGAQLPVQGGIVGFPEQVAGSDA